MGYYVGALRLRAKDLELLWPYISPSRSQAQDRSDCSLYIPHWAPSISSCLQHEKTMDVGLRSIIFNLPTISESTKLSQAGMLPRQHRKLLRHPYTAWSRQNISADTACLPSQWLQCLHGLTPEGPDILPLRN